MQTSERTPAAEGTVKSKVGSNDNTEVDLTVKHLARPTALEGSDSAYVVWAKPTRNQGEPAQNLGRLELNDNLAGNFKTVTPYKNFDLFITAEPVATVSYPTGYKVLWTHVDE